jgi:TRAP-type C4-dicarboxylate transport system substrate-binding protein
MSREKGILLCLCLILIMGLLAISISCAKPSSTPAQSSSPTPVKVNQPTVLRLSVGIPEGDPNVELLKPWCENFNKAANGKFEMRLFAGGSLLNSGDSLDALRTDVVDIAHGNLGASSGHDPAFGVCEVPYLLNNYEANYEFLNNIFEYTDNILQTRFNQKLLSFWTMGFTEFYTSKKPVKVMEDIKGLNVGVYSPYQAKSAKALGGAPVLMEWTDEASSFQKGLIDASMIGAAGGMAFMKAYEYMHYYVPSSRAGMELDVSINLDKFKQLPADLQKVMIDEGRKYQEKMNVEMKNFSYVWAIDEFKKHGIDIYNLPVTERDRWKAVNQPIMDEYFKQLDDKSAQFFKDAANKANAKFPYTGS